MSMPNISSQTKCKKPTSNKVEFNAAARNMNKQIHVTKRQTPGSPRHTGSILRAPDWPPGILFALQHHFSNYAVVSWQQR